MSVLYVPPSLNLGFCFTGSTVGRCNLHFPVSPQSGGGGNLRQFEVTNLNPVKFYCKIKDLTEAEKHLDLTQDKHLEPDVARFTSMVGSFCENGRVRDALEVFDEMSRRGCKPTIRIYNCLLKGLCYVGRIEEAKELMKSITKSNLKPDIYTYIAIMNGLCKVGRTIEALELLDEAVGKGLSPNVAMYNTLFNGYFKQGRPLLGFGLLKRMVAAKCKPDHIIYSTMIHGLLKLGKVQPAHQVYREMIANGFHLDERLMNTLCRGLCRGSRQETRLLKDVYSLFEGMKLGKYTIYPCAYNLLVEAFCRGREMDSVFEIIIEMIEKGHSPKTFTFNIAIHGLCSVGEVDKALAVLMLMHQARKSHGIPFNALINELNAQGRALEACTVYGMALKRGVVPKSRLGR